VPPSEKATLVWISPVSAAAGVNAQFTLTGSNFANEATVAVTGTGITVSDVKVVDATQITATLAIARDAATEGHDVTVNTTAGNSNALAIRVTAKAPAKKR